MISSIGFDKNYLGRALSSDISFVDSDGVRSFAWSDFSDEGEHGLDLNSYLFHSRFEVGKAYSLLIYTRWSIFSETGNTLHLFDSSGNQYLVQILDTVGGEIVGKGYISGTQMLVGDVGIKFTGLSTAQPCTWVRLALYRIN